jgi:CheY-like chemotaxis protein
VGVGTRAEIWLPRGHPAEIEPGEGNDGKAENEPTDSLRILLVDDHEGVRATTAALLCDLGHKVIEAADGPEVIALLERHPDCCDVLITDYAMPHVSGAEVIRQVRAIRPNLPAIIITGYADAESIGRRPDDVGVLSKPFRAAQLIAALKAAASPEAVPGEELLRTAS